MLLEVFHILNLILTDTELMLSISQLKELRLIYLKPVF